MQTARKIGIVLLAFLVGVTTLSQAVVYFEMSSMRAASRAELADDLGLGLLGIFIVVPESAIGGAVLGWIASRRLSVPKNAEATIA